MSKPLSNLLTPHTKAATCTGCGERFKRGQDTAKDAAEFLTALLAVVCQRDNPEE